MSSAAVAATATSSPPSSSSTTTTKVVAVTSSSDRTRVLSSSQGDSSSSSSGIIGSTSSGSNSIITSVKTDEPMNNLSNDSTTAGSISNGKGSIPQERQEQEKHQISQKLDYQHNPQVEGGTSSSSSADDDDAVDASVAPASEQVAAAGEHHLGDGESPLPPALKRILLEVAATGTCTWLLWDQEIKDQPPPPPSPTGGAITAAGAGTAASTTTAATTVGVASSSSSIDVAWASTSGPMRPVDATNASSTQGIGGPTGGGHPFMTTSGGQQPSSSTASFGSGGLRQGGSGSGSNSSSRQKHRNGIHKGTNSPSRMRLRNQDGASNLVSGRKRPLFSTTATRTHSSLGTTTSTTTGTTTRTTNSSGVYGSSAPNPLGSGRTSGSEPPDDSMQYECDSEGTSATTNSEASTERMQKSRQLAVTNTSSGPVLQHRRVTEEEESPTHTSGGEDSMKGHTGVPYKTLQGAFRVAVGLVLDHFYHNRGGYKLSPAEERRHRTLDGGGSGITTTMTTESSQWSSDNRLTRHRRDFDEDEGGSQDRTDTVAAGIFQQRRQRLMMMLLPASTQVDSGSSLRRLKHTRSSDDPPFTIQRIAEVLISPERYYTQTHKICNCLEKLLLVTSSTVAFGGSTGGETSQSRREEQELAALAHEKERQQSELRQRRIRRRMSSPTDELVEGTTEGGIFANTGSATTFGNNDDTARRGEFSRSPTDRALSDETTQMDTQVSPNEGAGGDDDTYPSSRQQLEAAARASLRNKFEHVGIDPHHTMTERDALAIAEGRGMTNSPPPSSLAMCTATSNIAVPSHSGVAGFVRQHSPERTSSSTEHHPMGRIPSPILFASATDSHLQATTAANMHMLQLHHAAALAGGTLNPTNTTTTSPLDLMAIDAGTTVSQVRSQQASNRGAGSDNQDLEVENGRSSASNSDVDSESDDVSFDDSASDRSDGSDSGPAVAQYEPYSAARAMALSRMQQQQRIQGRVLGSNGSSSQQQGEGYYRPPKDSDYPSGGDVIDSTRAEDSGGSDSSSSDLTD